MNLTDRLAAQLVLVATALEALEGADDLRDGMNAVLTEYHESINPPPVLDADNADTTMQVGAAVKPADGRPMFSGSQTYGGAIVLSMEPFVLTSVDGDMRWASTVQPQDFAVFGQVTKTHLAKVMRRLEA